MKIGSTFFTLALFFHQTYCFGGWVGNNLAKLDQKVLAPVYQPVVAGATNAATTVQEAAKEVVKELDRGLLSLNKDVLQPVVAAVDKQLVEFDQNIIQKPIKVINKGLVELDDEILRPIYGNPLCLALLGTALVLQNPAPLIAAPIVCGPQIEQLDLAWQQQEQIHTARSPLDREKLKKETRQLLGLSNSSVNVVATGVTGSGKASLINGLRGLRNKQPSAAPVGETNATGLTWYADVSGEWKFYKLAKQATFNASGKDYFEENGLYAFDAIVIVFTVGLRQIDATLCKEAKNWGVPVYFVRNKCDEVLTAAEGDFGLTLDEGKAQLRNNTRQMLQSSLEFCGASQSDLYYVTADSYVLPSKLLFKMDEERLKTRVMQRTG